MTASTVHFALWVLAGWAGFLALAVIVGWLFARHCHRLDMEAAAAYAKSRRHLEVVHVNDRRHGGEHGGRAA